MDENGPGLVVRSWMAWRSIGDPGKDKIILQVHLHGSDHPVIECTPVESFALEDFEAAAPLAKKVGEQLMNPARTIPANRPPLMGMARGEEELIELPARGADSKPLGQAAYIFARRDTSASPYLI